MSWWLNKKFHTNQWLLNLQNQSGMYLLLSILLVGIFLSDTVYAVTVNELQAPIVALKSEIFGGWMMVVKICAATAGIVMSAFRGSLAPFGIGAGLAAGIHLYDAYLGTGAAGALI